MMRHIFDYYMDGHIAIQFCKVCSAEGDELSGNCKPSNSDPFNRQKILDDECDFVESLLTNNGDRLNKRILK